MSWPQIALGDLCDIKIGKTPARAEPAYWSGGTLPWLSIADMNQGRNLQLTKECVTEAGVRAANMKLVEPGTLLLSYKLSIGKVGIAQIPMYTNEAIAALSDLSSKLDPSFMYWALQHVDLLRGADRAAMGATLNKAKLSEIKFPVPPLDEQSRIAAILDEADALRAKRREAIAKLDQLLQSVFLDMFGDPVTNPKKWAVVEVSSIGEVQGGLQLSGTRASLPLQVPYLRVANVRRGRLDLSEIKSFGVSPSELARTTLEEGDILVVEGHGNANEIGRCAVWDGSLAGCSHQNHLIRLRVDGSRATSMFVASFLNSEGGRSGLTSASNTTSGLNTISVGKVRACHLLLPPLQLQQRFGRVVEAIGQQMLDGQRQDALMESLFSSLQHRAFTGTL